MKKKSYKQVSKTVPHGRRIAQRSQQINERNGHSTKTNGWVKTKLHHFG
jgi:hypothetical protein